MRKIGVALISVYDKKGVVEFAGRLSRLGIKIISTGKTAAVLSEAGIEVKALEQITGFSELLGGRVKSLHPKVYAGILARRSSDEHLSQLNKIGADPIDMVVVDFYPFERVAKGAQLDEAVELVDIGGPAMARAAAKNFQDVLVVPGPRFYNRIASELEESAGAISKRTRMEMAAEVFARTARYDALISSYLAEQLVGRESKFPAINVVALQKVKELRYGENPHQTAALFTAADDREAALGAKRLSGKPLSYNNIVDMAAALRLVTEFESPAVAIIKHRTPCGVACSERLADAYRRALEADPISAYGSIIACNRPVEIDTARLIHSTIFVEGVIAPGYTDEALELLSKKKNRRFLLYPKGFGQQREMVFTSVPGGVLMQTLDSALFSEEGPRTVTEARVDDVVMAQLRFAWIVCKYVRSNAIVLARDLVTVGIGAGQTSRVRAARIAIEQAGDKAKGSVMASDAFFPFADTIEEAHKAGVAAIIQPGGSKRDGEVIEACNKYGIPMVFTGMRHFLH